MTVQKVLITGGSGFLGSALVEHLTDASRYSLVLPHRRPVDLRQDNAKVVLVPSHDTATDWKGFLRGVTAVVHCAAHVHIMDKSDHGLDRFREVNVDATLNLARQSLMAGVKRFIFISSIKVNGESTVTGQPFTASDEPRPEDAYGISKLEAEQALQAIIRGTPMELVIIRPVLIYGSGVKANFRKMMDICYLRVPLPFLGVDNKRSLVSVTNVVHLIEVCLHHPAAANEIFLVSDGADLSTSEIIRLLAEALDRRILLWRFPTTWMFSLSRFFRCEQQIERLCGSLQVDIEKNKDLLGWVPVLSTRDAFTLTAREYLKERAK